MGSLSNDYQFMIEKFLKFGLVGFFGLCLDFGLTYIFKEIFRFNKFIANTIGFSVAVISNYFLNRVWTFQNTNPNITRQLSLFLLVSLLGLILSTIMLYCLHELKKYNFYISKVFSVVVVCSWNFLVNNFITFS